MTPKTALAQSSVQLRNHMEMPLLGFGTYRLSEGSEALDAVTAALEIGYRMIDTASIYDNEKSVGMSVSDSGIPREELFITSKLWNSDHGYDQGLIACRESLDRIGTDYLDLYLIHWPGGGKRLRTWEAMLRLEQEGTCKSVGVSNYRKEHLQEIKDAGLPMPSVNQIEFNPLAFDHRVRELYQFCTQEGIVVEAYSPLAKGSVLKNGVLKELAEKYSKHPSHIALRWAVEKNCPVIPKSSHRERIESNADIFDFELSPEDHAKIDDIAA